MRACIGASLSHLVTADEFDWGDGFRNRREIVKKCLSKVGLSAEWIYHGIQREIFVVPLAKNTSEFLQGERSKLLWFDQSSRALFEYFKERWLVPRSSWDLSYKTWHPGQWVLAAAKR
jgi:hypothetical protein